MAEIKVERERVIWPWILLGLAALALVLYFFVFRDKGEPEPAAADTSTERIDEKENNATVSAYVAFVQADTGRMSLSHAYSNNALLKLIEATKSMAGETGFDVKGDLDKATEYANQITNDPLETTHADNIKNAAVIIAGVLHNLQEAKYPTLSTDAADVKSAAAAINPQTLALDQRDAINGFFDKAAALLQKMN